MTNKLINTELKITEDFIEKIKLDTETKDTGIIYEITNNVNGKKYIGQAKSYIQRHGKIFKHGVNGRFKEHCSEALKGKQSCPKLYASIRLHGTEKFVSRLVVIVPLNVLSQVETYYISKYDTIKQGYNVTLVARIVSTEMQNMDRIERIRHSMVERWKDPEYIAKTTAANFEAVQKRANDGSTRKSNKDLPANIYKIDGGYKIQVMREGKYKITEVLDNNLTDAEKLQKAIEKRDKILYNMEHDIDDSFNKKLDHNGKDLPVGIRRIVAKGTEGYQACINDIRRAITDGNLTMDQKLEKAKKMLADMINNKEELLNKGKKVRLDHNNKELPKNIMKYMKKGVQLGYKYIKGKKTKYYSSQEDTLDEKLELAIQYLKTINGKSAGQ